MSRSILIAVIGIVCMFPNSVAQTVTGGDTGPAAEIEKPPQKVERKPAVSDKAVVKDVVYWLEEGIHLTLASQPMNGDDRAVERRALRFKIPRGSQIGELSLEKLDGKNLMAVVKVVRGEEYDFHCLTFIAAPGGLVRDSYKFHEAKFHTTRDNLKILAAGGRHFAGSVFIVLGDVDVSQKAEFGSNAKGVLYRSVCPWPPSGGELFPFDVECVLESTPPNN